MAHTFTCLQYHFVFSTKERRPFLEQESRPRVHAYLGGIIQRMEGRLICIGGTDDHVHILCSLKAGTSAAEAMRTLKANSSKFIHEEIPSLGGFAWQEGYDAFSVSRLKMDAVAQYIQAQEQHHKTTTFMEEFVHLLKRHGVEYDERYVWG